MKKKNNLKHNTYVHMHGNIFLLLLPLNHYDLHPVFQYFVFESGHMRFYEFLNFLPKNWPRRRARGNAGSGK